MGRVSYRVYIGSCPSVGPASRSTVSKRFRSVRPGGYSLFLDEREVCPLRSLSDDLQSDAPVPSSLPTAPSFCSFALRRRLARPCVHRPAQTTPRKTKSKGAKMEKTATRTTQFETRADEPGAMVATGGADVYEEKVDETDSEVKALGGT